MLKYSRAQLCLYYLLTQQGTRSATARQIFDNMDNSAKYWDQFMPMDKLNDIRLKHGYTLEQWKTILAQTSSFYFLPNKQQEACNKEIKQLLKNYPCPNGSYYYLGLFSGNLMQETKRGKLHRRYNPKRKRYYYRLSKPKYNQINNHLKSLQ